MSHFSQSVLLSILGVIVILAGCRPVTPTDAAPGAATTGDAALTVTT